MTPELAAKLRAPFPPEAIGKLPKAGVTLDYVGHAATTDRLLQVDPDWSWEPFALDELGLPALDGEGNLWIRLTVGGVTRPGVGDGKNAKERISDALRNAAMRFGVALDLWAKEDISGAGNGPSLRSVPKEATGPYPEQVGKLATLVQELAAIDPRKSWVDLVEGFSKRDFGGPSASLSVADMAKLIKRVEKYRDDLQGSGEEPQAAAGADASTVSQGAGGSNQASSPDESAQAELSFAAKAEAVQKRVAAKEKATA